MKLHDFMLKRCGSNGKCQGSWVPGHHSLLRVERLRMAKQQICSITPGDHKATKVQGNEISYSEYRLSLSYGTHTIFLVSHLLLIKKSTLDNVSKYNLGKYLEA